MLTVATLFFLVACCVLAPHASSKKARYFAVFIIALGIVFLLLDSLHHIFPSN